MFGFGRKKAPEWASFFNGKQFEMFMQCVKVYFDSCGDPYEIDDGMVRVRDANDEEKAFGLLNLAQACHQSPPDDWDSMIEHHFSQMAKSQQEHDEFSDRIEDFASVRDKLALRLYPTGIVPAEDVNDFARRTDLDGTVSMLVLDLPSSIMSIPGDTAQKWNLQKDKLFEIALANVRRMAKPTPQQMDLQVPNKCWLIGDNNFLTASFALMLDEFPQCLGTHGTLIAVPTRHVVLCHGIENLDVVTAVTDLIVIAQGMERDGPGSITSNLYLRTKDGRLLNLPYEIKEKTLNFSPPDEFIELLNGIGG